MFQWPPAVFAKVNTSGGYYVAMYCTMTSGIGGGYKIGSQWVPYSPYMYSSGGYSYYMHHMWDVLNYSECWGRSSLVSYGSYAYESHGTSIVGTEYNTFTTVNGIAGSGGSLNIDLLQAHVSYDFGGTACVLGWWGSGVLVLNTSDTGGTYGLQTTAYPSGPSNECLRLAKVSASKYLILWKHYDIVGKGSENRIRYSVFDNTAKTFTPEATFALEYSASFDSGFDLFDAGEGYFYLLYVNSGNLYIRGIDTSSGVPVLTGLLGGSGTATFNNCVGAFSSTTGTSNSFRRYVTVGTDRVIALMAGQSRFVRFTYTAATKATPTIVTSIRTSTGSGHQVYLEYDPTDQSQCYLVKWSYTGMSPTTFFAEYVNVLGSIASNFTGYTQIHQAYPSDASSGIVYPFGGSAAAGETPYGFLGISHLGSGGYQSNIYISFRHWHTPVNYELTVDVAGTSQSVTITGRTVSRNRSVTVDRLSAVYATIALPYSYYDTFTWALTPSTIYEYTVNIASTYTSVTVTHEILQIVEAAELNQNWINTGYTYMDDFMVYINQDRAAVGMAPLKTWGKDGLYTKRTDVATLHGVNMARTRTHMHESINFPQGQQTISERGDLMPASAIGENIQFGAYLHLPTQTNFGYTTAYDAWLNWHNSPPHYGNIIRNWGADTYKVYSVLGMDENLGDVSYGSIWNDYMCLYMCNNFVMLETLMFEITLTQYWDNTGALISELSQQWSNDSWVHVSARHEATYGIKVGSSNFSAVWGARVAAQHEAPITYTSSQWHQSLYDSPTARALQQVSVNYDIKNTVQALTQNSAVYGLSVVALQTSPWSLQGVVKAQAESGYSIEDTTPVASQNESGYGIKVSAQSSAEWTINTTVVAQNISPYGEQVAVRTQQQSDYALLLNNPVRVDMSHYYAMQDYVSTVETNNTVSIVLADGTEIRVQDGVIASAVGDVGYTFECAIYQIEHFSKVREDDPLVVNFCGEVYDFLIVSKSMSRSGPAQLAMRIKADNAVVRTGSPYAQETQYVQEADMMASALVDALVEIDFTYEIVDWLIPAGRLQAEGSTPLEAVQQIAEAAGGVVDGTPDGKMRVRYPYPHPTDDLDTATIDQNYSDDYDNLSSDTSTLYRDGANKFRIREGDAAFSDIMEWLLDDPQTDPVYETGIVKAYLSPYRTTAFITHLGNAVQFIPMEERIEEKEELIEFNEGVGNTAKPIDTLVSWVWVTADMGTPTFTPYSTLLNVGTTVNYGYGLAKVKYNTRHLTAWAAGLPAVVPEGELPPSSAYAYFILEDSNG